MKIHTILNIFIGIIIFFSSFFSFADEGEWEILLNEFEIDDIAIEGNYIWCGTVFNGVLRYDKTDGSYIKYTTDNGLPGNSIRCIAVDKNGVKWMRSGGMFVSFDDTTWTSYGEEETGSFSGHINIAVDHDNVKWFVGSSIASYNDTSFTIYDSGYLSDIFVDHNNVKWFADSARRIWFDGNEWTVCPRDESFTFSTVAIDHNNRQFWGGGDGLRIYEGEEFIEISELFDDIFMMNIIVVDENNIKWFGADRSLVRYDDVEFKKAFSFTDDEPYGNIFEIEIDDDGSIWFLADIGNELNRHILAKYTPEDSTTHVEKEPLPEEITLHQTHPNPFNPTTTIQYEILFDAQVTLVIYDILGREISVLQDGMMSAGFHNEVWNGRDSNGELTGSGVYIYQLVAGEHTAQGKMLLLR